MKVLAIVLLCAFAAVQGRSVVNVVDNSSSEVALDNKPWVVHLRYAVSTTGLLQTAVGSLITPSWVLTTSNIATATYIWNRFGANKVSQPARVYESTAVQIQGPIATINLNRVIEFTDLISPISLSQWVGPGPVNGESCGYGLSANGAPGENLLCSITAVEESEEGNLIGSIENLGEFDMGAALVSEGEQSAVLVALDDTTATYVKLDFDSLSWISQVTGLQPPTPPPQPDSSESKPDSSESNSDSSESNSDSSESDSNSSESEEGSRVNIVNL